MLNLVEWLVMMDYCYQWKCLPFYEIDVNDKKSGQNVCPFAHGENAEGKYSDRKEIYSIKYNYNLCPMPSWNLGTVL